MVDKKTKLSNKIIDYLLLLTTPLFGGNLEKVLRKKYERNQKEIQR